MIANYKYSDKEIEELVKSLTILIDTREKQNAHLKAYWDKKGILYKTKALSCGDYSFMIPSNTKLGIFRDLMFDKNIVIERKGSLEELSGNLTTSRDRLEKEFALAPVTKVLLIENGNYSDVVRGNYDTKYNKKSYWATLHSFWFRYNIPVFFMPDPTYSGVFIRGYFTYYLRNLLR